jgi:hypothetical protein
MSFCHHVVLSIVLGVSHFNVLLQSGLTKLGSDGQWKDEI